ncbi:signal peptidase I [Enterococcus sp. PF1-24]|uniref:signal peptidase I n=1 Tax=unclassified Enterococcus TaxID=2608891 RepID=UPI002474B8E4|nr:MULTISPECIES: signal peptidase I [unclassified Enterococcus]MDH6364722.1 signal peptidase I [Enterococcus sp. PFB1-1]MDH6401802.1 signal peptidase I [Enterococcus sp. PF1-24]
MFPKIKRFQKRLNNRLHLLFSKNDVSPEERRKRQVKIDRFWLTIKYLIVAVAIAVVVRGFLLIPVPVTGNSMETTLYQDDMVVMEKFTSISRFDIIVFQQSDGKIYIKRVIGLPGENVVYQDDQLYINGEAIEESFLKQRNKVKDRPFPYTTNLTLEGLINSSTLPENNYFVLGDNRGSSKDSRTFGAINEDMILGKVRFVYYPLDHIKLIDD